MKWPGEIIEAQLIKRYKRFLADFRLPDGSLITAHCANTGSMKTCTAPDALCWLTFHDNPKRKLKYSWQAICLDDGWVGINTALANHLVHEAIDAGLVESLQGYQKIRPEQKYGSGSRIDLLLQAEGRASCYVEVKNVTLLLSDRVVGFPDAVSSRATKHLSELTLMVEQGERSVLFYCVQRASARRVTVAESFDPTYAKALRKAVAAGVEVLAWQAQFSKDGVTLVRPLPVTL